MSVSSIPITDLLADTFDEVIDVRSPAEFAIDHMPGAVNLPVLSDPERAEVGTMYTRVSRFEARRRGAALVSRNIAAHLEGHLAGKSSEYKPLVYCWRGGQRSGAMALVLAQIGWRARVLEGGYRSYRRQVVTQLYDSPPPTPLIVLEGRTGSAKTELLSMLPAFGVQCLDLEGLAAHRGSVFGAMPGLAQPSQKLFESRLARALASLDPTRPVLVEGESSRIGKVVLPTAFWQAMCAAHRITVSADLTVRAAYLTRAYGDICANASRLETVLSRLVSLQGHEQVDLWRQLASAGEYTALAAGLMERHYDPAYDRSMARHQVPMIGAVKMQTMDRDDLERTASAIATLVAR